MFLWYETTHAQNILPLLDAQFLEVLWLMTYLRLRHPVVDQMHVLRSATPASNQLLDDIRDDNHVVSIPASHTLTEFQHRLRCESPLVTVVVRSMVRKHHLHAQQFRIRHKQCGADGMNMHHISSQLLRLFDSPESMDNRLKRLLLRCFHIDQLNALPFR